MVLPEDAGSGLAASSAAQERSLPSRSGVIASGEQQAGGCVGADAVRSDEGGRDLAGDPPAANVHQCDLLVELGDATGQGPQRQLGDRQQVVAVGRAEARARCKQLAATESTQLVTQLVGGGSDDVADLVQRLGAGLVCAAVYDFQRT